MASTPRSKPDVPKEVQVAKISSRQAIVVALITSVAGIAGAFIGIAFKGSGTIKKDVPNIIQQAKTTPETTQADPKSTKPDPNVGVHRISIEGVDYPCPGSARRTCAVRVVAEVNGQAYSYPSRSVWADIGREMSKEQFPLVSSPEYAVNIRVFVRYPSGKVVLFQSQLLKRVKAAALPAEEDYTLLPIPRSEFAAVPETPDPVRVHYRIE